MAFRAPRPKARAAHFLTRLSVRFSKPVRNGSTLTTRAWRTEDGLKFTILDESGEPVITHGLAEIAPVN